ncbi:MAG: hypothetical protein HY063_05280 [Bacteroidetes bacterium]|nr:hypothetical protein [Bacteroidota bacterium]
MENWGQHFDRQIFYLSTRQTNNWAEQLPTDNWLALTVGHDKDIKLYNELADKCIDKNVLYVCAVGHACELIHDIFDQTVIQKKIAVGDSVASPDDFENSPMTTWHNDFEEGVWFAMTSAFHGTKDIDKIVVIDLTDKSERQRLTELIDKIKSGFIPD